MPSQASQFVNPLALLELKGDPNAAADNAALRKLQTSGAIQRLSDTAAGQRSAASDRSRLMGQLAPQGLSPEDIVPGGTVLPNIRRDISAQRQGDTVANMARGGGRAAKGTSVRAGEQALPAIDFGNLLPGEAQSAALPSNKLRDTTKTVDERQIFERNRPGGPGVPGAITKGTQTTTRERVTESKNTPEAKAANKQISEEEFTAGVRDGTIIEAKDQTRFPGFWQKQSNGRFLQVSIGR